MLRFHPSRIGWILVLTLGLWAAVAQAKEFRYHYVSLDDKAPPGFDFFFPAAINDSGRVSGTVFSCDDVSCFDEHVAIYKDGAVRVLQPGFGGPINAGSTIAGGVVLNPDPNNLMVQAALFRGSNKVALIPPQPEEVFAVAFALNDSGTALVDSFDTSFNETLVLYKHGQTTVLDFGPTVTFPSFLSINSINNQGIIAGRTGNPFAGARGFRFNPRTGETKLLNPFPGDPTETLAWGLGINAHGEVLGYSFTGGVGPYHERIGVWDRNGDFKTYFVETTNSNRLRFNDNNLIVITFVRGGADAGNSYLVPKPGVRLNLADLVENLPPEQDLSLIEQINNHGDMIGSGPQGTFLLQRIDATEPQSFATPDGTSQLASGVKDERRAIPPAAAAMLRRYVQPLHELKSGSALPQDSFENPILRRWGHGLD
jgi:hypothetical protein